MASVNIHACCIAIGDAGVLLRGPSGSGKSDLALRMIDGGADLVADDRVDLRREGDSLIACSPKALAGLIEATGLGPLTVPYREKASIVMIADLVPRETVERLPEASRESLLGVSLPRYVLDAFGTATPAKLRLLATGAQIVTRVTDGQ